MRIKWHIEKMDNRCEWGTGKPLPIKWGIIGETQEKKYSRGILVDSPKQIPFAKRYIRDMFNDNRYD